MSDKPICVDCKHYNHNPPFEPYCGRLVPQPTDPVSGAEFKRLGRYCRFERQPLSWFAQLFGAQACGPEGRFFERKAGRGSPPNCGTGSLRLVGDRK